MEPLPFRSAVLLPSVSPSRQDRLAILEKRLNGKLALRHAHFEVTQRTFLAHLKRSLPFSRFFPAPWCPRPSPFRLCARAERSPSDTRCASCQRQRQPHAAPHQSSWRLPAATPPCAAPVLWSPATTSLSRLSPDQAPAEPQP